MYRQSLVYLAPSYCRLALHTCTTDFWRTLALHTRDADLQQWSAFLSQLRIEKLLYEKSVAVHFPI